MSTAADSSVGGAGAACGGVAPATGVGTLVELVRLTKPRITLLVVLTGLAGMWLAVKTGAAATFDWGRALSALGGVALVVSGANALNMHAERDVDALMARTKDRPLPACRLDDRLALAFGLAVGLGSVPLLAVVANALTAALAAISLFIYVWVYTPLKRVTPWAVVVGAIPGAMPPLLGWTSATGSAGALGLATFAILFFWQLPHFLAIATFRASEYARAGIKVLPLERDASTVRAHAVAYSVALVCASLTVVPFGVRGRTYVALALVLGAVFCMMALRVERLVGVGRSSGDASTVAAGDAAWARRLFFASLVYLPVLFGAMMADVG